MCHVWSGRVANVPLHSFFDPLLSAPPPQSPSEWLPGWLVHFTTLEIKLDTLGSFLKLEEVHGRIVQISGLSLGPLHRENTE